LKGGNRGRRRRHCTINKQKEKKTPGIRERAEQILGGRNCQRTLEVGVKNGARYRGKNGVKRAHPNVHQTPGQQNQTQNGKGPSRDLDKGRFKEATPAVGRCTRKRGHKQHDEKTKQPEVTKSFGSGRGPYKGGCAAKTRKGPSKRRRV